MMLRNSWSRSLSLELLGELTPERRIGWRWSGHGRGTDHLMLMASVGIARAGE